MAHPTQRGRRMPSWSLFRIQAKLGTGHGPVTRYFTDGVQRRADRPEPVILTKTCWQGLMSSNEDFRSISSIS